MSYQTTRKSERIAFKAPKLVLCAVYATCFSAAAHAQEWAGLPAQLLEKVEAAQQACSDFENGQFALEFGAVQRIDLDGDFHSDWALNEAWFSCSSAASLYCGTGGCMSHFLIEDAVFSLLNRGWDMTNLGPDRVLLADVHGSQCEGINPTPCVVASVWDAEERVWRSTTAQWE